MIWPGARRLRVKCFLFMCVGVMVCCLVGVTLLRREWAFVLVCMCVCAVVGVHACVVCAIHTHQCVTAVPAQVLVLIQLNALGTLTATTW